MLVTQAESKPLILEMDVILERKQMYICRFMRSIDSRSLFSTIQHEFIHSLGSYHIQSRGDRDKYVTIDWSNIKRKMKNNFRKHSDTLTYDIPYDPLSIMHYGYNAFAIDRSKPTIYSKIVMIINTYVLTSQNLYILFCHQDSVKTEDLGVTDQMRESDIKLIRNMYGCGKFNDYILKN